ncbi:MAG: flagellar basal body P-ring formation chaperone FlgA [Parvularculaceae bacterium]|nr:flagellar basal body P-ring formation chaperone FlgA [Parvularculaceae bacterium]
MNRMRKFDPKFAGLLAAAVLSSGAADAEEPTAARNIRVGSILTPRDIDPPEGEAALREASTMIGLEAARAILKGEPITLADLRRPTLVTRNALVSMEFERGALVISTEGRALEDGAAGQAVRVMNLASKRIVSTVVVAQNVVRTKQ